MVVGLDYRDVELSVHDLLQELKTHQLVRKILEGGERIEWGAKTIPEGGFLALPKRLHAPGLLLCGDGAGLRQRAGAEGDPLRDRVGRARGRGRRSRRCSAGEAVGRRGALASYDEAVKQSFVWRRPRAGAEHAPGVRPRLLARRRPGGGDDGDVGASSRRGDCEHRAGRRPGADPHRPREALPGAGRQAHLRQALVGLPRGNKTRDDQPSHIRVQTRVPPELAELWARMCPAQVYEVADGDGGRRGDAVELRPVRRDHRQGRPADSRPRAARGPSTRST